MSIFRLASAEKGPSKEKSFNWDALSTTNDILPTTKDCLPTAKTAATESSMKPYNFFVSIINLNFSTSPSFKRRSEWEILWRVSFPKRKEKASPDFKDHFPFSSSHFVDSTSMCLFTIHSELVYAYSVTYVSPWLYYFFPLH